MYSLAGPKDSLRNKYELNDPKNLNCPCYKYQKKAEREFFKEQRRKEDDLLNDRKIETRSSTTAKVNRRRKAIPFFEMKRNRKSSVTKKQNHLRQSLKSIFKKDISACPRL